MRRLRLINPANPLNGLVHSDIARRVTFGRKAVFMPLGLMVAAGVVPRDEWAVEIVDECTGPVPIRNDVDLVGITAMTCQAARAYQIADAYLALGVPVILGGLHPSALPDEALNHATAVAIGEAEGTLPAMLADLKADRLSGIYRPGDSVEIATPRRDLLNRRDYLVNNCVQISRGCPHRCRFCTTQAMYGGRYSVRPIEAICQEISELKSRWLIFADDNIVGNIPWSRKLFVELGKLNVRWSGQASLNVARDEEMLRLMKANGCQGLILGLESPNPAALAEGNKTYIDPAEYLPLIERIQRAGIGTWGSFLFGFDADTVQSLRASVAFARRARLDIACFPILTPYPGTPLWDEYRAAGRILTDDWARYNGASVVFQPKQMSPQQLAHCQVAAFGEFYSLASMWNRLTIWPMQKIAWLINIAINQGFRYYFRRTRKRMPDFRESANWR
jgi:radical SAM superfamily enzyme YgiQ (UPF0313 family)